MASFRLDQLLLDKGFVESVKEAQGLILSGVVCVDDHVADKPGVLVRETSQIRLKEQKEFVSRGGLKLAEGLRHFCVQAADMICADIGASSGGFTDCLLQNGAKHVFAVDVAYGQLSWKIRQDQRVTVIGRFNAKSLSKNEIPLDLDLAVIDASFISLTKLLPPLLPLFRGTIRILALIKPQFELPREEIGPGGVVTDPAGHARAIEKIAHFAEDSLHLQVMGTTPSPIYGPKGNREFIIYLHSHCSI